MVQQASGELKKMGAQIIVADVPGSERDREPVLREARVQGADESAGKEPLVVKQASEVKLFGSPYHQHAPVADDVLRLLRQGMLLRLYAVFLIGGSGKEQLGRRSRLQYLKYGKRFAGLRHLA